MDNNSKVESMHISASARLISQLGEQLISDELVALMELIKNSYDADATQVKVNVDTNIITEYGVGKITIEDNGNGMVPSIIKNGFLRLSTNFKNEFKLSPFFKRKVLGNKGLGRLSFQRLGRFVKVVSSPRTERLKEMIKKEDVEYLSNYNIFQVYLDWGNLQMDVDLNTIEAEIDYSNIENPRLGTKIEILGIKNQNFWYFKKRDERRLKNEIFGMVNPFVRENNSNFQIYLNINGKSYTNESINEDTIEKISDVKIGFSFENWILNINVDRKYKYLEREIKSIQERMKKLSFIPEEQNSDFQSKVTYKLNFKNMDILKENYPYLKNLRFDIIDNIMADPGKFSGVIYSAEFSSENQKELIKLIQDKEFTGDIKTYNELKAIWEAANGIYMFRNDFRILPYGKKDWIGFTKKSQTYKNNIYKEHTIAGYINIDGETSENLVEQTNRLGIVEDEYGNNFMRLFQEVLLEIVVRDDVKFRSGFDFDKSNTEDEYIYTKNKMIKFKKLITEESKKDNILNEVEDTVKNVNDSSSNSPEDELRNVLLKYFNNENEIEKILKSSDETVSLMLKAIVDALKKGKEVYSIINSLMHKIAELKQVDEKIKNRNTQEKYLKDKEISELYGLLPMVGQGIIVESLTHELNRIDENIRSYAIKSREILNSAHINIDELLKNQQLIIDETAYLREQLNHLEPTYRKNSKIFEQIDIKDFINDTYIKNGPMSKKAINRNVQVILSGESFFIEVNKGFLITVFDNLFLNSLYWIEESRNKNIYFEIHEDGRVIMWDSGPGIHRDIEKELFEPFKSMKKEGRGLGLFIVNELLNDMNANIDLLPERRNDRLYKFQISFKKILEE